MLRSPSSRGSVTDVRSTRVGSVTSDLPLAPSPSFTEASRKATQGTRSNSIDSQVVIPSFPDLENDDEGDVSVPAIPPPSATVHNVTPSSAAANRVVTGFRAATIPEYKGHMPRSGHTAITYKRDFYIFGGINNKNQYPNHIYCHEKRSLQWEEIRGVGVVPTGRANHSAVVHKNKMFVYGGHRYLDVFDDLYSYDLDARRWDKIGYEKSQGPGPVFLHAGVYIPPTQSMAIIGGFHQREYNMYVGHTFDIRNRVWNGIPGPHAINLQHLQLVTATFDAKSTSIVVLGFSESNTAFNVAMPSPYVYMMNIHSFIWTKVETVSSPESPIPFRLDIVWEKFMREFIMMGGYHDTVMHSWYFPITLDASVEPRTINVSATASSISAPPLNRGGRARYGFFKLQMDDMKWSIIPTSLPKKLMAELAQKNRDTMLMKKSGMSSSVSVTRLSRSATSINSKAMLHNIQASVPGESSLAQMPTAVEMTPQKKAMLFSVDGDPQFQRKYAYAVSRDGNAANNARRKSKAMQYLIMHGGLIPGLDYTMLMLTPQLSRSDAFTAARLDNEDTESSLVQSQRSRWSDDDEESQPRSLLGKTGRERTLLESLNREDSMKLDSDLPSEVEASPTDHCLLPCLPCTQNKANTHRFAILYHQNNSMREEELLPYPTTPAAILEAEKDIQHWSERYYSDTRRWLSTKLHGVMAEDRQLRRMQKSMRSNSGSPHLNSDSDDDDSSVDERQSPAALPKVKSEKSSISANNQSRDAFTTNKSYSRTVDAQTDFFLKRGLQVFDFDELMRKRVESARSDNLEALPTNQSDSNDNLSDNIGGLERLKMKVKRHQEQQRLPSSVFFVDNEGGANMGDLGSAMAFVLMQNALNAVPSNTKEERAKRARIRWRFLRALVRTGEAAFIIYRVSQEEAKMKGLAVTSSPGLLLAPELHLIGPSRPYKVSFRPVPYTVTQNPKESSHFAEVSPSGMVVYHQLNYGTMQ